MRFSVFGLFLFSAWCLSTPFLHAQIPEQYSSDSLSLQIRRDLDSLVAHSRLLRHSQVGIYVYDMTALEPLFAYHARQRLRPASTTKLITAITALTYLGDDYNYKTELYEDGREEGHTFNGNFYIKAGFDPRFNYDDLNAFLQAMKEQNIDTIQGNIIIDRSLKDSLEYGWGWCWDDPNARLDPMLYDGQANFLMHLKNGLEEKSIVLRGKVENGRVGEQAVLLATRAHNINQILMKMLKHSNNLYAESMFYQIAAQQEKAYADRKDALIYINRLIEHFGLNPSDYVIADGCGLSLYNYVTPQLLVAFLRYAYNQPDIYLYLKDALPIAGVDGTLEHRMRSGNTYNHVFAKTGTLSGVSSLAGYTTTAEGHQLIFAIMNQGIRRASEGRRFQDEVCRILTENPIRATDSSNDGM